MSKRPFPPHQKVFWPHLPLHQYRLLRRFAQQISLPLELPFQILLRHSELIYRDWETITAVPANDPAMAEPNALVAAEAGTLS